MHKKFEINRTKIKGGCKSGRKVVTHNSKSDLPLLYSIYYDVSGFAYARNYVYKAPFAMAKLSLSPSFRCKLVNVLCNAARLACPNWPIHQKVLEQNKSHD